MTDPILFTPYLDSLGITPKPDANPIKLWNMLDAALAAANRQIDWGVFEGKRRKPCPEQPLLLTGAPIGQYHCPVCGMMLLAAMPHFSPEQWESEVDGMPLTQPCYEEEYGQPWPPGYEEEE